MLTSVSLNSYPTIIVILFTTVMLMLTVPTPKDRSLAIAKRDTLETESRVSANTSCLYIISATTKKLKHLSLSRLKDEGQVKTKYIDSIESEKRFFRSLSSTAGLTILPHQDTSLFLPTLKLHNFNRVRFWANFVTLIIQLTISNEIKFSLSSNRILQRFNRAVSFMCVWLGTFLF